MESNRPRSREKNVIGQGSVHRRGEGLGGGHVGSGTNPGGRNTTGSSGRSGGMRAAKTGGAISLPVLIIIAVIYFLGGGLSDTTGSLSTDSYSSTTSGWSETSNSGGKVDTTVASGSRAKRTSIYGDGSDVVTLMVYMCGTDLESKSGMATNDINEMLSADIAENVNVLIYTGGCTSWRNNVISSQTNQIYKIENGRMKCLEADLGSLSMVKPDTLSGFISYCKTSYPANRYQLILWDHGGGSLSGYGYDEKYKSDGSMNLANIAKALKNGGVTFDFVGFDACLMATAETATVLSDYSDYMIASEETEPGIGWYYTNFLTKLSADTSMPTTRLGQMIIDDYTNACAGSVPGQKTTLSLIDLAEFSATVPSKLSAFSKDISSLIKNKEYKTVSDARYGSREFAQSSRIDQVDLVNLAENMNTDEGRALSDALRGAVKYNRTSSNMSNAYGISIYFPYRKTGYVDNMCRTYDEIGMDEDYTRCIRQFASLEVSGQEASGGQSSPLGMLLGIATGSSSLTDSFSFMSDRALSDSEMSEYLSDNRFDASSLIWQENADGIPVMSLSESQWDLVHSVDMNMFYDDGAGYIDLGLDNIYDFDEDGNLVADVSGTWLSIGGEVVAYYHTDTYENGDDYYISGYVPCLINEEKAKLILSFDNDVPTGYIAGVQTVYDDTSVLAKTTESLNDGDVIEFTCDYYSYDGEYIDSYRLGEPVTYSDDLVIGDLVLDGNKEISYRFTDIYAQSYWVNLR